MALRYFVNSLCFSLFLTVSMLASWSIPKASFSFRCIAFMFMFHIYRIRKGWIILRDTKTNTLAVIVPRRKLKTLHRNQDVVKTLMNHMDSFLADPVQARLNLSPPLQQNNLGQRSESKFQNDTKHMTPRRLLIFPLYYSSNEADIDTCPAQYYVSEHMIRLSPVSAPPLHSPGSQTIPCVHIGGAGVRSGPAAVASSGQPGSHNWFTLFYATELPVLLHTSQ